MAVGDAYVFPGSLTPVLTQLFFPKPPTTFLTCFCRGERRKYPKHMDFKQCLIEIFKPYYYPIIHCVIEKIPKSIHFDSSHKGLSSRTGSCCSLTTQEFSGIAFCLCTKDKTEVQNLSGIVRISFDKKSEVSQSSNAQAYGLQAMTNCNL